MPLQLRNRFRSETVINLYRPYVTDIPQRTQDTSFRSGVAVMCYVTAVAVGPLAKGNGFILLRTFALPGFISVLYIFLVGIKGSVSNLSH
jgi:hypothetical protein